MKGPFEIRAEALEVAVPGEEVWCRDAAKHDLPWCVLTKDEADEDFLDSESRAASSTGCISGIVEVIGRKTQEPKCGLS